jgi:hypothetical protein
VEGSQNVLFSFNAKNKHDIVGNVELPKDKFAQLKAKLLEEIRDELQRKKKLPSLVEMITGQRKAKIPEKIETDESRGPEDKAPVEEAFSKTTKVLLGQELHSIDSCKICCNRQTCLHRPLRALHCIAKRSACKGKRKQKARRIAQDGCKGPGVNRQHKKSTVENRIRQL